MAVAQTYGLERVAPSAGVAGVQFQDFRAPRANLSPLQDVAKGFTVMAERYRDDADRAILTAAGDEFYKEAIRQRLDKDSGFLNKRGLAALQADSQGRSLIDTTMSDLEDARNRIADKFNLSSRQRKLWLTNTEPIMKEQMGFVTQHVFEQNNQFQVDTRKSHFALLKDRQRWGYSDPNQVNEALREADEYSEWQAQFYGYDKDQAAANAKANRSSLTTSMLDGALTDGDTDDNAVHLARAIYADRGRDLDESTWKRYGVLINDKEKGIATREWGVKAGDNIRATLAGERGYIKLASGRRLDITRPVGEGDYNAVVDYLASKIWYQESRGSQYGKDKEGHVGILTSHTGARGIGQIQPETAKWMMEHNPGFMDVVAQRFPSLAGKKPGDPEVVSKVTDDEELNKWMSKQYLLWSLKQAKGNIEIAIGIYGAGLGNMKKAIAAGEKDGLGWKAHTPKTFNKERTKVIDTTAAYVDRISAAIAKDNAAGMALTNSNGKAITPDDPEYARRKMQPMTREEVRAMVMKNDPRARTDSAYCNAAVDAYMDGQKQAVDDEAQRRNNAYVRACEADDQGQQVPFEAWRSLTPDQQAQFRQRHDTLQKDPNAGDASLAIQMLMNAGGYYTKLSETDFMMNLARVPQKYRAQLASMWRKSQEESGGSPTGRVAIKGYDAAKSQYFAERFGSGSLKLDQVTIGIDRLEKELSEMCGKTPEGKKAWESLDYAQRGAFAVMFAQYLQADAVARSEDGAPFMYSKADDAFKRAALSFYNNSRDFIASGKNPLLMKVEDMPYTLRMRTRELASHYVPEAYMNNREATDSETMAFFVNSFMNVYPGFSPTGWADANGKIHGLVNGYDSGRIEYLKWKYEEEQRKRGIKNPVEMDPLQLYRAYVSSELQEEAVPSRFRKTEAPDPAIGVLLDSQKLYDSYDAIPGDLLDDDTKKKLEKANVRIR